ncbi:MAG TPA: hypothetical protein VM864_04040 [Pyrinomonadaceae bacterium]|jgi:uncharacterized protein with GYD domain|nr:hypothetical protein [Pyrinomonadaceae bacterium]
MTKKILSLVLVVLLINLCGMARVHAATKAFDNGASTQESDEQKRATKVKKTIAKFGAGRKEFVIVKMRDGGKKVGHITEVSDDNFAIREDKTGAVTSIGYADVKKVQLTPFTPKNMKVIGIAAGGVIALVIVGLIYGLAHGQ